MKTIEIIPVTRPPEGEVNLPGSLSYTTRALALAFLSPGSVEILNAADCDDVSTMKDCLKKLSKGDCELNVHLSGRTARTILALACVVPGEKIISCDEAFKKRPMGDLVDALRSVGAKIEYLDMEGFLPVRVLSSSLYPGKVRVSGKISSQFLSALLMIAAKVGLEIEVVDELSSSPFVDMTIEIMKAFGLEVENRNYKNFKVTGGYSCNRYDIEGDATAASYFIALNALTGSKVKINGLNKNSKQGDIVFEKIINSTESNFDMKNCPDIVPTVAVMAAFAKDETYLFGLENLAFKESNRIECIASEFRKMGIKVETGKDFMKILGGNPHGALIDTHGDHRIAMAFAIAGLKIPGILIQNPDVVCKSFPNFFEVLKSLKVKIL